MKAVWRRHFRPRTWGAALLGGFMLAGMPAADAAEVDATAKYVVSLAGNIVAQLDVGLDNGGADYDVDIEAHVAGLGQLVARGTASVKVTGATSGSGYSGESFSLTTRTDQGTTQVNVAYSHSNVTSFTIDPPLPPRYDLVPIERSQLTGVNDGISAFILKNASFDRSLCNRRLHVFTGFERFDLNLSFAAEETATSTRTGYQGPVVLCQIDYTPISGHYETSEITNYLAQSDRILIWYAPLGTSGTAIPYRVLIGTAMGDLSVVLTSLSVTQ
ncbi:MAG: DUF3108 domain-containing protein [Hyphomicrobiaceae bacterium]|nr:DUF3108 domain-containing protein [Hyphomicrobiaceae bacterium]